MAVSTVKKSQATAGLRVEELRWASRSSRGMCPASGDAFAVPSEEGVGGDDPAGSPWAGECGCDRAEHSSVVVVEVGSAVLALEDGELVAEDDDLEVFRVS